MLLYKHQFKVAVHQSAWVYESETTSHSRNISSTALLAGGKYGRWRAETQDDAGARIPWPCVHEFVGIVTHPRIFCPPSPLDTALEAMRRWAESPRCEVIGEGPGYFDLLHETASTAQVTGPMTHDARIAAICLHNGVSALLTCDRDFSRFARLKTVNLLSVRK